jgi:hypothetical protein
MGRWIMDAIGFDAEPVVGASALQEFAEKDLE